MNSLIVENKQNSPLVNFNAETGVLQIVGRSIPEHPVKFYQPLEDWLDDFLKTNPTSVKLHIFLDYLNTHSTECILLLLKKTKSFLVNHPTSNVLVEWLYEEDDEDMEDLGKDLKSITVLPFQFEKIIEE